MKCPKCKGYADQGKIRQFNIKTIHCLICGFYEEHGMRENRVYHQKWLNIENKPVRQRGRAIRAYQPL